MWVKHYRCPLIGVLSLSHQNVYQTFSAGGWGRTEARTHHEHIIWQNCCSRDCQTFVSLWHHHTKYNKIQGRYCTLRKFVIRIKMVMSFTKQIWSSTVIWMIIVVFPFNRFWIICQLVVVAVLNCETGQMDHTCGKQRNTSTLYKRCSTRSGVLKQIMQHRGIWSLHLRQWWLENKWELW